MLCTHPGQSSPGTGRWPMLGRFLPKEVGFFEFFEKIAAIGISTCKEFLALTSGDGQIADRSRVEVLQVDLTWKF